MKQKTILFMVLAAFTLTAAFSGCLGNGNDNHIDRDEADIRSVTLTTNGSEVIATVVTELDFDEKIDTANVTVRKVSDTIFITILSFEHITDTGSNSNIVEVKLGNISEFNDGNTYSLVVNNENDRDDRLEFKFENNTLLVFKEAFVRSVTFETDGNNLIAVAEISGIGANDSVDEENITKTRFDLENEMDIYVPLRTEPDTPGNETVYERIVIGQLDQLSDGRYFVEINDRDGYFTIQSGALKS
ncbi:hypothetical protein [Methanimicrococcus hongohii]|nr:hypothetical protein [Methanimicrococcus sp. Hf6]